MEGKALGLRDCKIDLEDVVEFCTSEEEAGSTSFPFNFKALGLNISEDMSFGSFNSFFLI